METVINNQLPLDIDEGKRKREAELLQKPKVKKPNEEVEVNSRKKPGRKRLEVTESNTKKEKNRVAQRAWRERKEKYVTELEKKIAELESAKNKSENEKQQLKLIIEKLRSENTYLKNATSFIFTPTKETQMFMEQNKLKVLQQKNMKQNNQTILNNSIPMNTQAAPVTPDIINSNSDSVPSLAPNSINETLLQNNNQELFNELYKLMNVQNSELLSYQDGILPPKENQESTFNQELMTPNSLMSNSSPPMNSELVVPSNSQNMLATNSNSNIYENIIIPSEYELNSTIPTSTNTSDPNLLLLMNEHNQNKDLAQALLNQQQLNTINQPIGQPIGQPIPGTSNTLTTAALPNQTIDQNSLLAMTMLNNSPATFANIQQSTLATATPEIHNINNNLYQLNNLELNNAVNAVNIQKPINGSMNYRSEAVKEKSQPITEELFNNVIQMLHQQQQENVEVVDEDELLIQRLNQQAQWRANQVAGIPSPTNNTNYGKDYSTKQNGMNMPFTPEDLESESNKSNGEIETSARGIPVDENDNAGNTSREVKIEGNSSHSTLQFPAEQKPTKLDIPYSVFPRVTQETVDSFINDAKLTEEEIECLCSELKNKATCKEKLMYITKNIEIKGWDINKWENGKIRDVLKEKEKEELMSENQKIKNEIKENVENK